MKLRNKKTGEIVEFRYLQSDHVAPLVLTTYENNMPIMHSYNSLAELCEEWEDYEEPKEIYFISNSGRIHAEKGHYLYREERKEIGNYFETKEEAEKAVEKLKALERLKENNLKCRKGRRTFVNTDEVFVHTALGVTVDTYSGVEDDLDLLFGGEE